MKKLKFNEKEKKFLISGGIIGVLVIIFGLIFISSSRLVEKEVMGEETEIQENFMEIEEGEIPELRLALKDVKLEKIHAGTKDIKYPGNDLIVKNGEETLEFSDVEVKGRGNSTWMLPKRPYQIKFDEKISLFGMGEAKKYILLADYNDVTHMRNNFAFYLANLIEEDYAPKGRYVDLYVDEEYQGLYFLTTKNEIGKERINLKSDFGIVFEMDNAYAPDDEYFVSQDGDQFVMKDVKNEDYLSTAIGNFKDNYNLFEKAVEEKDFEKISEIIDVESFVKYYLLTEFTMNPDGYFTSVYFYKDGIEDKIYAGPIWDFDIAFGFVQDKKYGADAGDMVTTEREQLKQTNLYKNLMQIEEFQEEVSRVYEEKIAGKLEEMSKYLDRTAERIKENAERDGEKWGTGDFSEGVKELKEWIFKRYEYFEGRYE